MSFVCDNCSVVITNTGNKVICAKCADVLSNAASPKPTRDVSPTQVSGSAAYTLERNLCDCHWQTCCCADYVIYSWKDLVCSGNDKQALERLIKDANGKR